MPKSPRRQSSTGIYHVMARGVSKCIIYEDDRDRLSFLRLLSMYLSKYKVTLHAWCLMDNHYHLLVEGNLHDISRLMRELNSTHAVLFNEKHGRVGHLFQGRFTSVPVESDEQFLTELRYIHQNPLKDGITPTCDYRWSSYRGYFDEPWLVDNTFACSFFDSEEDFEEFHAELDLGTSRVDKAMRRLSGQELLEIANSVLCDIRIEEIAGLPRTERNSALRMLKDAGLSIRQIERLTGVSKGIVERA